MREWYKNNFDGKRKGNTKLIYFLIPIWLLFVFYYGGNFYNNNQYAKPILLSKKLTSSLAELDLEHRIAKYNSGIDQITYIVEAELTNKGKDGFVAVDAAISRSDTIFKQSESFFIKKDDTLKTKFYFNMKFDENKKRRYSVRTIPLKYNPELTMN